MKSSARLLPALIASLLLFACATKAEKLPVSKAAKNARVYIVSPQNGQKLKSPITVVFGLQNMGIAPAGVKQDKTGHHHLIINGELPPEGKVIQANETYKHFGGGQTETKLDLPPGKHTLQLVLGDHIHVPHSPMIYSKKITVEVVK